MPIRPFEITVTSHVLRGTLRGYWDLPTADAYVAELIRAAVTVSPRPTHWLMNFSDFPVQAAEVADRLSQGVSDAKRTNHPIVAIVGNSALGAMQGRRVARHGAQTRFATLAAAEEWLGEQMAVS